MAESMGGGAFLSGALIGGKYRLQRQIGEGAMGVVWAAVNTATNGQVALELILRSEPELRHRLLREAQACGTIRHKNVVQVYDVGQTDAGDPFLVMELLQGRTLAALLASKRRLPPDEAAAIARDVARALAAAHREGIVHRDLKPANIFLHIEPGGEDEPVVKVVDFGVSKNLLQSDGLRTVAGGAVGSPMYMSPEQARADRDLDGRADLWSLGVVLYEMLTGERPFSGESAEVLHKILNEPIPRAAKRVRRLDADLDRIVSGCLTRDLAARLGPAADIAKQLEPHAVPAARGPLPSLMDTGGAYDMPPVSGSGSDNARLSPGSGRTSLQGSPGYGRTDLRPSSGGGAPAPTSSGHGGTALSSAASAAAEMHRSGSWGDAADGEDMATIPLQANVLAGIAARPPADPAARPAVARAPVPEANPAWGPAGGGTVPIHLATAAAGLNPAPMVSPPAAGPPSSSWQGPTDPLQMSTEPLSASPKSLQIPEIGPRGTVRLSDDVRAAAIAAAPAAVWSEAAGPVDARPASPQAAGALPPAPRASRVKPWVVVGSVIALSSLTAVAIWLIAAGPRGASEPSLDPVAPPGMLSGAPLAAPPTGAPLVIPPSVEPTAIASQAPAPEPPQPLVAPTATEPAKPVKPVASIAPSGTVPTKLTGTIPKPATTKPACKNPFGLTSSCPKSTSPATKPTGKHNPSGL